MLSSISKVAQYSVLLYFLISVAYTTHFLLFAAYSGWTSLLACTHYGHKLSLGPLRTKYSSSGFVHRLLAISSPTGSDNLIWPPSPHNPANRVSVSQETLLSKTFTQSLHPTKIIPYYYRASLNVDQNDVTITTLVTRNRFKVLKQLVERYQGMSSSNLDASYLTVTSLGPVSVTIHVPLPIEGIAALPQEHPSLETLRELDDLYHSSPYFATYVDVHLAYSPFSRSIRDKNFSSDDTDGEGEGGRQFNVWRNVARLFARTDFVMMLDVDFAVCTDWRTDIRNSLRMLNGVADLDISGDALVENSPIVPEVLNVTEKLEVFKRLKDGSVALVVPVFEFINQEDGVDQRTFPQDKAVTICYTAQPLHY